MALKEFILRLEHIADMVEEGLTPHQQQMIKWGSEHFSQLEKKAYFWKFCT